MELSMKAHGRKINSMEQVFSKILSKIILLKELKLGLMVRDMKARMKVVKKMEGESLIGQMDQNMKEISKTTISMDLVMNFSRYNKLKIFRGI